MDLPGHGNSSKFMEESYTFDAQVENINNFANTIGLDKFHIVGNSMGGRIAGEYAAKYQGRLLSLGLFAPIGIRSAKMSDWQMRLSKGENILMATTYEEYNNMLEYLYYKVPSIYESRNRADFQRYIDDTNIRDKIISDLKKSAKPHCISKLKYIKASTLILWGDKDRIVDVSAAEVLDNAISNSKTVIIKDIGHMPMMEEPDKAASIYIEFLDNI